jgi:acetolactate synthase-1/2/3 large subunit
MVDKAFDVAMSGVPGPVFLEVPVDLLYPEAIVRDWYIKEAGLENPKNLGARALQLYLRGHLYRQFHAPHLNLEQLPLPQVPSVRLPRRRSNGEQIQRAAEALRNAKQPALVIGSQTMVNCTEPELLANAVRSLGMPTWLGGTARGLLGRHSDIQFRHKRSASLKTADVVVIAGFPFDFRLGYGRKINKKGILVSANLSANDLRKNRRPDIAIEMHPGQFIQELAQVAGEGLGPWDEWFAEVREREQARDADIASKATPADELVNPLSFFLRLEDKMADDAVLIVDGGDFVATAAYTLRPRKPLQWLDPGVFGTLGVGGGFAVGASAVHPGKEIWLIYGDGSSAYSLAEFDTYARHGMAPIAVIGTDASWGQIARDQVEILGSDIGTVLERTPYHKVAEGYGGKGLLLTEHDKIDQTIDEAKQIARSGKPVCINIHLARSDFRKGSLSM